MSRRYRTLQKTLPIAAVTKNAAIDLMYSGGPKTHCNRRHIAAVFAPAATARFSCSVGCLCKKTDLRLAIEANYRLTIEYGTS